MATGRLAARLGRATDDPAGASRESRSPAGARVGIDVRKLRDGGIGRYLHELLGRLPGLAPHLQLVALARPADEDTLRRRFPTLHVVPVRSPGYSVSEHLELAWVARRERLALLHAPHYVFPRGIRCPVVVTVHDLVHWRLPRSRLHAIYCRRMLAAVRRRARVVLTPSESVARDLVAMAGFDRRRIVVAPNGLSEGFAAPPDEAARLAFGERLGASGLYVLSVTNGLPHKGLDVLLAALAPLSRLSLVLAGAGSDRPAVLRQVRSSGIPTSRVAILGAVPEEELRLLYQAARVVAVPSLLEGFGLPALEAMASGTPVVASDAGALPEVVGDAGLLVPAGSVAELRVALYRIAFEIDPTERASLVQRGLERSRLFSWERTARETLAAYEQGLRG